MRLGFGVLGLAALTRPRVFNLSARAVALAIVVGSILALHHLCFYEAVHRLPLGVAVTLEFAGPLTVAVVGFQRGADFLWAALATAGVAATAGLFGDIGIDLPGVLFALAAGACWAAYIVIFPKLASRAGRSNALALSTLAAAVAVVPWGIAVDGSGLFTVRTLLLGVAVAALSDVVAYTLQSEALTRITGSLFSILISTEPAAGAILGLAALGQRVTGWQWAGMLAVTAASIGATRTRANPPASGEQEPAQD